MHAYIRWHVGTDEPRDARCTDRNGICIVSVT